MNKPIEKMTLKQLEALQAKVADAISSAKRKEVAALKSKIADMAAKSGLALDDVLVAPKAARKPRKPNKTRHVNPNNTKQTWSGMGRPPKWFKEMNGAQR